MPRTRYAVALAIIAIAGTVGALGAIVLAGNVSLFPADHTEYVAWVRDPRNGFCSAKVPLQMGGELSVKVGA